jgi:hypothetical protein
VLGFKDIMILTAVSQVAINFGKPEQQELGHITVSEAKRYFEEGQFPAGSMGPKIEAAITELKDILKDESATKEQIEEKVKTLTEASHKVTEEMYKAQAEAQGCQTGNCQTDHSTYQRGYIPCYHSGFGEHSALCQEKADPAGRCKDYH